MRILISLACVASASAIITMLVSSSASSATAGQYINVSSSMTAEMPRLARSRQFYGESSGCPKQVLYLSDKVNDVVRIYPLAGKRQKMCGMIGGFNLPQALAVDLHGNLYVADTDNARVLKFAPGSTTPSLTIPDPGQFPAGVCVNAKGTIGVTNIVNGAGGQGSLSIYNPDGSKVGTLQDSNPNVYEEFFCKMDANGNVYTTGSNEARSSGAVNVFMAPSYAVTDLPITLEFPGGVDLVGDSLYIDDQHARTVTAYKNAKGPGKGFYLNTSFDASTFEFTSNHGALTFYTSDAELDESQEYLFGKNNDINYIRTVPGSRSNGVAVTRDF